MASIKGKVASFIKRCVYIEEDKLLKERLKVASFDRISNCKIDGSVETIAFIIPTIKKGMGGITSILRLGTGLEKHGLRVSYVIYNPFVLADAMDAAKHNLSNYKGEILGFASAKNMDYDVVIASDWLSVYYAKKMNGYKMYFVQDFEPYMYSMSDSYYLALKTYSLGFHIVSLGKWNCEQIIKNCDSKNEIIDFIDFPYEKKEYAFKERNFSTYMGKNSVNIAVYVKREKKRAPSLILDMCKKTYDYLLERSNILVSFKFFGLEPREKVPIGINLGKLNKEQLFNLYNESDFGMCASLTNVSLVPYEMLGSGLPIFEFEEGSFSSFLDGCATMINFDYLSLANAIENLVSNPSVLSKQILLASKRLSCLSWDNSCAQFLKILDKIHS